MKAEIEVDMYVELQPEGFTRSLYIGDDCEPTFSVTDSWEEVIERNIEYYLIPGSNKIDDADLKQLEALVKGLKTCVKKFEKRIKEFKSK